MAHASAHVCCVCVCVRACICTMTAINMCFETFEQPMLGTHGHTITHTYTDDDR